MGNDLLPLRQSILSNLLDTRQEMAAKTCELDNVFPPDDSWFASDTNTTFMDMCDLYSDV